MYKKFKKLMAMLVTFAVLLSFVPDTLLTVLAENISVDANMEIIAATENNYILYYSGGIPAHTLTVKESGSVSGTITILADNSGVVNELVNKGTITGNVEANSGKITNSGSMGNVSVNSAEFYMTSGSVGNVSINSAEFHMTSGSVAQLSAEGADSSIINLGGGTVTTINAPGKNIELSGNVNTNTVTAGKFTGTGTLGVTDSLTVTDSIADSVTVNVGTGTTLDGSAITSGSAVVTCDGHTYDIAGKNSGTIQSIFGRTVSVSYSSEAHFTLTNAPEASDIYMPEESVESITVTAADGYYFPEDYSAACTGSGTVNTVRVDVATVNVSYTLAQTEADDITITLPDATPKETQAAPTGLKGSIKTIENTNINMEYTSKAPADALAADWKTCSEGTTAVSGNGIWYVRYKETDVKKPGAVAEVAVKDNGKCQVTMQNYYYGAIASIPAAVTDTNEGAAVTFFYKVKGADDSAYTKTVPTQMGDYTVKAVFDATDFYSEAIACADFSIEPLAIPANPYTLYGTTGSNGFYISNVTVTAADGYLVSDTLDGTYFSQLVYDADKSALNLYFKKTENGAKTLGLPVNAFMIDKSAPVINGVINNQMYYGDTLNLTVSDRAISNIWLNGKEVPFTGNSATLNLFSNGGVTDYTVKVQDLAGNITQLSVTLAAEWTKTGMVPEGKGVSLSRNQRYTFGSGTWQVNGDATSYNGDASFYVRDAGEYVFTKQ